MRSWVSAALVLALGACGDDREYVCATSALTYQTFGEPFMANWCRGCHSSALDPAMRQHAPLDVNFDELAQIRAAKRRILELAADGDAMPPRGGPSDEERALLHSWLACGAP